MASLISGDSEKREKIYKLLERWNVVLSVLLFIVGIGWFFVLPHKMHVHRTYMSENALSPGLVTSDIQNSEEVSRFYEFTKKFFEKEPVDIDWIRKQFEKINIEAYTQHFNVTNPFRDSDESKYVDSLNARNVYAIARAQRTPSHEAVVVSAPLTYLYNGQIVNNVVGISQMFILAKLAKTQSYWAKDLIFVVSDVEYFGIQAWLNAYFDIESKHIQSDNLKARGGAIQAALNLQIHDPTSDKLLLKIEGPNGQLPNLDLFNTVIRICKTNDLKCGLDNLSEHHEHFTKDLYDEVQDYKNSFENTIKMMFRQATGVPSSLHGFFLRHHIEALTVQGVHTRKSAKHNTLKMTRIIEGTLRSVNNLLERFHQSFFFYLLPNERSYVSIGMYMPPLGLLLLPAVIQLLFMWQQLFRMRIQNRNKPYKTDLLKFVLPDVILALMCTLLNYIGTAYFMRSGLQMNLEPKDAIISSHLTITINSIVAIFFLRRKIKFPSNGNDNNTASEDYLYKEQIRQLSWKIKKFMALIAITVFIGTLSLLNFSLSFFLALVYVPLVLCLKNYDNKLLKVLQALAALFSCPLLFFALLYAAYYAYSLNFKDLELSNFHGSLTQSFYDFVLLSKVSAIWTYDLVCLALYPIWLLTWFISI